MPADKKPTIYRKMLNVVEACTRVKKTGRNDFQHYDYATEEDILNEIRPHLVKQGLMIMPSTTSERVEGDRTVLNITYKIVDVDSGDMVECTVQGQGSDKGDKGGYKAMTGAQKYFFTKTFMIPTGDDPEKEHQASRPAPRVESHDPDWINDDEQTPPAAQQAPAPTGVGTCKVHHEPMKLNKNGKPYHMKFVEGKGMFCNGRGYPDEVAEAA